MKNRRCRTIRGTRGFTAVEVVAVLTLAAVIMAIAGPPLARVHSRAKLRQAVDALAAGHALARATAIQNGRVTELHIDPASNRHWVEVDTGGRRRLGIPLKGATTVGPIVWFRKGNLTSNRTVLCFDPRGIPTTTGDCEPPDATVVFTLLEHQDTLRITGMGRVIR